MLSHTVTRRLLTDRQAAVYIGQCQRSMYNLAARKLLPYIKIGKSRRYDLADLDAFIEARKIKPAGWKETKGRRSNG